MKYQISEDQYRKIILNYLNSVASDFIFEEDHYENDNWLDVLTSNGSDFGSLWFKSLRNNVGAMITQGCNQELALDEDFTQEFEELIPIIHPKIFSQVVLEYFNSKTGHDCDCIEFYYFSGEYDKDGSPMDNAYRYNTKNR